MVGCYCMKCCFPDMTGAHICRAAWQLACDAPHNSILAKYTSSLDTQPPARYVNKDSDWPACLATLAEHTGMIFGVAISRDGTKLVSCCEDKTIK